MKRWCATEKEHVSKRRAFEVQTTQKLKQIYEAESKTDTWSGRSKLKIIMKRGFLKQILEWKPEHDI